MAAGTQAQLIDREPFLAELAERQADYLRELSRAPMPTDAYRLGYKQAMTDVACAVVNHTREV